MVETVVYTGHIHLQRRRERKDRALFLFHSKGHGEDGSSRMVLGCLIHTAGGKRSVSYAFTHFSTLSSLSLPDRSLLSSLFSCARNITIFSSPSPTTSPTPWRGDGASVRVPGETLLGSCTLRGSMNGGCGTRGKVSLSFCVPNLSAVTILCPVWMVRRGKPPHFLSLSNEHEPQSYTYHLTLSTRARRPTWNWSKVGLLCIQGYAREEKSTVYSLFSRRS